MADASGAEAGGEEDRPLGDGRNREEGSFGKATIQIAGCALN